jgi:hypothetical protein
LITDIIMAKKNTRYPRGLRRRSETFPDGSRLIVRGGGYQIIEASPKYNKGKPKPRTTAPCKQG